MTESKESKEDTIHKLTSFSWQRKLNERNSFSKNVNSESDQFWKAVAKPNSNLRSNGDEVVVKQTRQSQAHAFKTKNELMPVSKQSRDDYHFVKLEGNENDNKKTLLAVKETSCDQKGDRQFKNRTSYNGQNYRKDEKENVNHHKNVHKAPANQIYTQTQKNFKRFDKNQNFRNTKGESSFPNSNEDENFVKKDQRNSTHQSSWNNNPNNRTYHRNQEKPNNQNNNHRNEAKNRNSYQNVSRNQNLYQSDLHAELPQHTKDSLNRNIVTGENSFSNVPSSYSESGLGVAQENPPSAIHYQRTFSPKMKINNYINTNITSNQATKSAFDEKLICRTEFAQLDPPFGNSPPKANTIYSRENNDMVKSKLTNFSSDLFSNHFTAGISEPIPSTVYQTDMFPTNIQMNQSSNTPTQSVNYMDSYIPSQPLLSNNFNDASSYSNQMFANALANNDQRQFVDEPTLNDKVPVTFSSLSPDVADFIPRKQRIQSANRVAAYSNSVENLQPEYEWDNRYNISFSTPNNNHSQNVAWLSQNNSFISDSNGAMITENEVFQPYVDASRTFNQNNSAEGLNDISNLQPNAVCSVPNNTNNGPTFNFNGRMINLSAENKPSSSQTFNLNERMVNLTSENTQSNVNQCPSTNDTVQNYSPYGNTSIGNQFTHDLNNYPGISNYPENLGFNNQQISNILQIANLNLNQETAPLSPQCNQRLQDLLQVSNLNVNENILKETNASILSQTIVNNSPHESVCGLMQNSRATTMCDYYRRSIADAANRLKRDESEAMNSKLEMVAQQLFNVNKYATGAEMSGGTMQLKGSVCHSNSEQYGVARFNQYNNELEKFPHSRNFLNQDARGSLLSPPANSENRYENLYTPTSIVTCKSYDSFSPQTFSSSNFIRNEDTQFGIVDQGIDGKPNNNNSVLSTQFISSLMTSDTKPTNDFQNNYGRSNVQRSSNDRYRQTNSSVESNSSIQSRQNSFKSEFTPNHDRKPFNNQVRKTNNKPDNYMYINVRDDCFINFNQKNRPTDSSYPKFNATVGKPPSMGILKKPPKPILDTSIHFQKPSSSHSSDDLFSSSKEPSPLSKRVSFLLENE